MWKGIAGYLEKINAAQQGNGQTWLASQRKSLLKEMKTGSMKSFQRLVGPQNHTDFVELNNHLLIKFGK